MIGLSLRLVWCALLLFSADNCNSVKTILQSNVTELNDADCIVTSQKILIKDSDVSTGVVYQYDPVTDVLAVLDQLSRLSPPVALGGEDKHTLITSDLYTAYNLCEHTVKYYLGNISDALKPEEFLIHDFLYIPGNNSLEERSGTCTVDSILLSFTLCEGAIENNFWANQSYEVSYDGLEKNTVYILVEQRRRLSWRKFGPGLREEGEKYLCRVSPQTHGLLVAAGQIRKQLSSYIDRLSNMSPFIEPNELFANTPCRDYGGMRHHILSEIYIRQDIENDNNTLTAAEVCEEYKEIIGQNPMNKRNVFDLLSDNALKRNMNAAQEDINRAIDDLLILDDNNRHLFDSVSFVNDNLQSLNKEINETSFIYADVHSMIFKQVVLTRFTASIESRAREIYMTMQIAASDCYEMLMGIDNRLTELINLLAGDNRQCDVQATGVVCGSPPYTLELGEGEMLVMGKKAAYSYREVAFFDCLPRRNDPTRLFAYNKKIFSLDANYYQMFEDSKVKFPVGCIANVTDTGIPYHCKTLFTALNTVEESSQPFLYLDTFIIMTRNAAYLTPIHANVQVKNNVLTDTLQVGQVYRFRPADGFVEISNTRLNFNMLKARMENENHHQLRHHILYGTVDYRHFEATIVDQVTGPQEWGDWNNLLKTPADIYSASKTFRVISWSLSGVASAMVLAAASLLIYCCIKRKWYQDCCTRRTPRMSSREQNRVNVILTSRAAQAARAANQPLLSAGSPGLAGAVRATDVD